MIARRPRQPIFAPKTRDDLKPVRLHPDLEIHNSPNRGIP